MSCVGVILWRVGVYSDVLTFGAHLLRQRKHWKCPPSVLLRSRCWQRNFAFTYLAPITFKYRRFIVYQVDTKVKQYLFNIKLHGCFIYKTNACIYMYCILHTRFKYLGTSTYSCVLKTKSKLVQTTNLLLTNNCINWF